jgi:PhnB protein
MSSVSTYLHFPGHTEEAFLFYQSVFAGEFEGGIYRFGGVPVSEDMPPMDDATKDKVMHVSLPILGGHRLMGTDGISAESRNSYLDITPSRYTSRIR